MKKVSKEIKALEALWAPDPQTASAMERHQYLGLMPPQESDFSEEGLLGISDSEVMSPLDEPSLGQGVEKVASVWNSERTLKAGTRVAFVHGVEALFTYTDCPDPGVMGTVVTVRTASGDKTAHEGKVFVLWDDGKYRPTFRQHLNPRFKSRLASSSSVCKRIKTSMDLEGFFRQGSDLIHKATKDLWSMKKEGDEFIIERLFQDNGEPLKV